LERSEPSAQEKARTGQVVLPTERGLEERRAVDVQEVLAMLHQGEEMEVGAIADEDRGSPADYGREEVDGIGATIQEISSSGMFGLDGQPDVADAEKLRYIHDALGGSASPENTWMGSAAVHRNKGSEPYILVSRGKDFADSMDAYFFAKTFPTLFPMGNGGPRLAEENSADIAECGDVEASVDVASAVGSLLSSRNMSLESWAKVVL
jgi:hypothetical protein